MLVNALRLVLIIAIQASCIEIANAQLGSPYRERTAHLTLTDSPALSENERIDSNPVDSFQDRRSPVGCDGATLDAKCIGHDRATWIGFAGIEGSKQPQDLGVNAHFGSRVAINYGRILSDRSNLGFQIGTSVNATGNAVQVIERIEGTQDRTQSYSTIGLFQRNQHGWSWATGYDFLYQDAYDQSLLGQWRIVVSRRISDRDEFGILIAIAAKKDETQFLNDTILVKPLTYGRVTWRHYWESLAYTTTWVGLAESHSETNVALGDLPAAGRQFLFGADFRSPLNRVCALYGEANFLMPADTGAIDAFLGIEFTWKGRHAHQCSNQSRPLLSLAGNPSFLVDGRRIPR